MTRWLLFAVLSSTSLAAAAEPGATENAPDASENAPKASEEPRETSPEADPAAVERSAEGGRREHRGYEPDQHGAHEECPPDFPGCEVESDYEAAEPEEAMTGVVAGQASDKAADESDLRWLLALRPGLLHVNFSALGDPLTGVEDTMTGAAASLGFGARWRSHSVRLDYQHSFLESLNSHATRLAYRWSGLGSRSMLRLGANAGYAWLRGSDVPVSGPTLGTELGFGLRFSPAFELGTGIDAGLWFVESDPPVCDDCTRDGLGYRVDWYLEAEWSF